VKIEKISSQVTPVSKPKTESQTTQEVKDKVELGGETSTTPMPKAKWLIMNYIAADCNLQDAQLQNLDDMELVGSDANTHILTQIDRGPKPTQTFESWPNARRYYVTKDATTGVLKSKVVEELGRIDMSNPETLKDFIVWGIKNYPADHVALILNDHGGGFTGAMADDSDGNFMSTPQLHEALSEAEKITGKKIDILGFDACLMAQEEVAYELKDDAKVMLASEESEGAKGWAYSPLLGKTLLNAVEELRKLTTTRGGAKVDVGPIDFAKKIVEVHSSRQEDIPTLSAIDLTKIGDLKEATDNLAKAIQKTTDTEAVKQAIKASEHYGSIWEPYVDFHDLGHLSELIAKNTTDENLKKAAEAVHSAVEKAVIAKEAEPTKYPNSHGISIYAPTQVGSDGKLGYDYQKLAFAKDTQWDEAVELIADKTSSNVTEGKEQSRITPEVWPDGSPRKSKEA